MNEILRHYVPQNDVGLEPVISSGARNPYYDPREVPFWEVKIISSPETHTPYRYVSGISHPFQGFEMTSTETVCPRFHFEPFGFTQDKLR